MKGRSIRCAGFTLIELMITVAIIGLLATLAAPMAALEIKRDRERELRDDLREIRGAIDAYKQAFDEGKIEHLLGASGYPPSLKTLVEGVPDISNPDAKAKIYFLRRVPRDPMFQDSSKPDEETWGLRSYKSSNESPEEGDDVYDVHSLSPGIGLNGIEYARW